MVFVQHLWEETAKLKDDLDDMEKKLLEGKMEIEQTVDDYTKLKVCSVIFMCTVLCMHVNQFFCCQFLFFLTLFIFCCYPMMCLQKLLSVCMHRLFQTGNSVAMMVVKL